MPHAAINPSGHSGEPYHLHRSESARMTAVVVERAEAAKPSRSHHTTMRQQIGGRVVLLLVLLRVGSLCISAAALAAALASSAPLRRMPFRFLVAADAIMAAHSAFQLIATAIAVATGQTLFLKEDDTTWYDFYNDQGSAYMALAAAAAAARDVAWCGGAGRDQGWMSGNGAAAACVQAQVAVGLTFLGFPFVAVAALITGFQYWVTCFLVTGSGSGFPPPPPPPTS